MTDPVKFVDPVKYLLEMDDPVKIIIFPGHGENLIFDRFDPVKILEIFLIR